MSILREQPAANLVMGCRSLVQVSVGGDREVTSTAVIHSGMVSYGGIAQFPLGYLVAVELAPGDPRRVLTATGRHHLAQFDKDWRLIAVWRTPEMQDMQQIKYKLGRLWIANCGMPGLLVVDPFNRRVDFSADLSLTVPPAFFRDGPCQPNNPEDLYHFSSLSFRGNRVYVLAGNFTAGSFVLDLVWDDLDSPSPLRRVGHFPVGNIGGSGDVLLEGDRMLVSDGHHPVVLSSHDAPAVIASGDRLLRGMAIWGPFILVAHGPRNTPAAGRTAITVCDRTTLKKLEVIEVGDYGVPADILVCRTECHEEE
jgi:hypothetical protein